jgi:hypothetical protein
LLSKDAQLPGAKAAILQGLPVQFLIGYACKELETPLQVLFQPMAQAGPILARRLLQWLLPYM